MSKLFEVEERLRMADYLLGQGPGFQAAAIKHIVEAANQLITIYLDLGNNFIGPILASRKLAENKETEYFAVQYGEFWKYPLQGTVPYSSAVNAYKATKSFLQMVKRAREPA
jgi:hypothetical protein